MGCGASSERPTASEPVAAKAAASKAAAEKTATGSDEVGRSLDAPQPISREAAELRFATDDQLY